MGTSGLNIWQVVYQHVLFDLNGIQVGGSGGCSDEGRMYGGFLPMWGPLPQPEDAKGETRAHAVRAAVSCMSHVHALAKNHVCPQIIYMFDSPTAVAIQQGSAQEPHVLALQIGAYGIQRMGSGGSSCNTRRRACG